MRGGGVLLVMVLILVDEVWRRRDGVDNEIDGLKEGNMTRLHV